MDFSSLERDDVHILFFRTSCDLGHAIDQHKGALAGMLRGESLSSFLLRKSADWMDRRVRELAGRDYDAHVAFVRGRLDLDSREATPKSKHVYQSILAALQTRTAAELATQLQEMADATHTVVGQAIAKFGGTLSATRWARCPVVELRFDHGEPSSTRCTFDSIDYAPNDRSSSGPSSTYVITVRIGSHIDSDIDTSRPDPTKGALRIYFNLHFYFFHEYVSHAFSVWQFEEFVEGYLMWAASRMMDQQGSDPARIGLRNDTFQSPAYKVLHKVHELADWFHWTTEGRFLTFLLEWAADESMRGDPAELDALNDVLAYCLDNPQAIARIWVAFENPDNRAIRRELRSLPKDFSGVPAFKPRLRRADS